MYTIAPVTTLHGNRCFVKGYCAIAAVCLSNRNSWAVATMKYAKAIDIIAHRSSRASTKPRSRRRQTSPFENLAAVSPISRPQVKWSAEHLYTGTLVARAVESEVPSSDSDSDSGQFRLSDSDSNSDSGPTPTFSCISYLK